MDITAYTHEQIAVIELSGRFDAHFAPQVKVLIERSDTPVQVLINLTAVTFIDSAALATLVSGMKRCRHVGWWRPAPVWLAAISEDHFRAHQARSRLLCVSE